MAYPVYIALRRHAVLKHGANFDAVLYGQPDMEPVECPYCELVAFTSPEVLQLHLAKIHPEQFEQATVTSAVASALAASDSDDDGLDGVDKVGGEKSGRGGIDDDDKDWAEENKARIGSLGASAASAIAAASRIDRGGSSSRRGRGNVLLHGLKEEEVDQQLSVKLINCRWINLLVNNCTRIFPLIGAIHCF